MFKNDNYLELCISEIYDIIMEDRVWPNHFTPRQKKELLGHIRSYYEKRDTVEDYIRCANIQSYINNLIGERTGSYATEELYS